MAASVVPSYLEFDQITPDDSLRSKFITETDDRLKTIFARYKRMVRLSFHQSINQKNVYLVMIVGINDTVLIQMANEYGFPRGFPVLWIPGHQMQTFGFYPKFANDEREMPDDLREFDNIVELNFFKKWSGFLGQLLAFEIGNKIYWTVTSKNSAIYTSPFVQDAKRLFEPYVTLGLIKTMVSRNLHLCAEIMSKNDQVHGARVLKETPIITAVGSGCYYHLADQRRNSVHKDKFVEFLDNYKLVDFCVEYNLPCDSAVMINDPTNAKIFIKELSIARDFMTDTKLTEMLANYQNSISVHKGTVNHSEILGNCLEGLVIKLKHSNESMTIKKYKFAPYTIRTMLLREVFNNFVFQHQLIDRAKRFVEHWCVSDLGKKFWYQAALQAFIFYNNYKSPDTTIGDHIHIADMVAMSGFMVDIENHFMQLLMSVTNGIVVICLGPIGSGKTSVAVELCKTNPMLVSIDGDILDLDSETVSKLGAERNDYTRWKIIEALMQGKIPVVSTGGGVLFSTGKVQQFVLRNQIYRTLGLIVKIVVCIACKFNKIATCNQPAACVQGDITSLNKSFDVGPIYNDLNTVEDAVIHRVKTGQWKMDSKFTSNKKLSYDKALDNFASTIAKYSSGNVKFASEIISQSDYVFGFPVITHKNYGLQRKLSYNEILSVMSPPKELYFGKFSQIRLLVQVNNMIRHITYKFSQDNDIEFKLTDFAGLAQIYSSGQTNGKIIKLGNGKNSVELAIPDKSIHDDGSTHITINPGNHSPKEMAVIAKAIHDNYNKITVPTKDKKTVEYTLSATQATQCKIVVLSAYGV